MRLQCMLWVQIHRLIYHLKYTYNKGTNQRDHRCGRLECRCYHWHQDGDYTPHIYAHTRTHKPLNVILQLLDVSLETYMTFKLFCVDMSKIRTWPLHVILFALCMFSPGPPSASPSPPPPFPPGLQWVKTPSVCFIGYCTYFSVCSWMVREIFTHFALLKLSVAAIQWYLSGFEFSWAYLSYFDGKWLTIFVILLQCSVVVQ